MTAGYMIINTFEYMYNFAIKDGTYDKNPYGRQVFGVPYKDFPEQPNDKPRYKGVGRDQLVGVTYETFEEFSIGEKPTPAENLFGMIQEDNDIYGTDVVPSLDDAREVLSLIGDNAENYEIIFIREYPNETPVPDNCRFLGCDAANTNFSCISDSMFFPKWHGTDPDNSDFQRYFDMLNKNGLFKSNAQALEFLEFYLSFDWTERSDEFTSIEIYAVE